MEFMGNLAAVVFPMALAIGVLVVVNVCWGADNNNDEPGERDD